MPHALVDYLVNYLVNAVWQAPLVAIGAAILTRVGGSGPRVQHAVWLAALALAVSLPLLPALAPVVSAAPLADAAPGLAANSPPMVEMRPVRADLLPPIELDAGPVRLIALAFAVVLAISLARLIVSWRAAAALVGRSRPAVLAPGLEQALRSFTRAHGRKAPPVRVCEEVRGPVVAGALWPVILVPRAFARLGEEDQRAALLHEAAHVVRGDFAINLACEAAAAPIAWHPVTHEIRAGVRQSREMACDALASAAMASPVTYARCLINLATALKSDTLGERSPVLVGLFGRGDLEDRLMHLIKGPTRNGLGRLLIGGAAACAILAPAVLLRVAPAYAQEPSPPAAAQAYAQPAAPPTPPAVPTYAMSHHHHQLAQKRYETDDPRPEAAPEPPEQPLVGERHIEETVRHAMESAHIAQAMAAAEAQKAMTSAEIRQALAEARARQSELTAAEREQIREAARQAAEAGRQAAQAWKDAHLEETLAQVRRQLNSPEMRRALHDAGRTAVEPPLPPAPPMPPTPPAPPAPPPPPPPGV
jgi:beta-lactamase regulating signal transducer with metallopeptidase domain